MFYWWLLLSLDDAVDETLLEIFAEEIELRLVPWTR